MNRQQKIAHLRSLGVTVADDITDEALDALFAQNENPASATEVSGDEVPPENPATPAAPPVKPATGAPPPAATLATQGVVTDERALELQRREQAIAEREARARETEMSIAERERKAQEREEALRGTHHVPPQKRKRKRNWTDPINSPEEIEED